MNGTTQNLYGHRLLPAVIDEHAVRTPEKVFAIIPRTLDLRDGFMDITYHDFATAIDGMAYWLEERMGRSSSFETLAYMGLSDMAYFIFLVAACKVGYKVSYGSEGW